MIMTKTLYRIGLVLIFCFTLFCTSCFAGGEFELNFDRDNKVFEISLLQDDGKFYIKGNLESEEDFCINGSLDDMILFGKKVFLDIFGRGKIIKAKAGGMVKGGVVLRRIIFGGKPLDNFVLNYEIKKDKFIITSCKWENFILRGEVNLEKPFDAKIDLVISEMDMNDFVRMLGLRDEKLMLSGRIFGLAHIEYKDNRFDINAQLHAWDGMIDTMEFKETYLTMDGVFPSMRFVDSWMVDRDNSYSTVEGYFDFSKLSNVRSPGHNVRIIPANGKVEIFDWTVRINKGIAEGLNLKKSISEDMIVSMDTFNYNDANNLARRQNGDSIGVEYKITEKQRLKMNLKDGEELLGWEQVFKF